MLHIMGHMRILLLPNVVVTAGMFIMQQLIERMVQCISELAIPVDKEVGVDVDNVVDIEE